MAVKQFFDIIEAGYSITGLQKFDVGTEQVVLPTRLFYGDGLVIKHVDGDTLVAADYTLTDIDQPLTTLFGKPVYKKLFITNSIYQTGVLTVDFIGVGDYFKSSDITDLQGEIALKLDKTGGALSGDLTVNNILPNMVGGSGGISLKDIGSPTAKFRAVYADEVFVGAHSLYVNGKKVIEDVSNIIEFKTDIDQGIALKTVATVPGSGNANLTLQADNEINVVGRGGIEITVPTGIANKDVVISTASANGRVELQATTAVNLTAPTIGLAGTVEATNLTVTGNLTVSGTTTTLNTTTVTLRDNVIELNKDQTGIPASTLTSGIEVNRGDSPRYKFIFDEGDDAFKVGEVGTLQAVATRQDAPAANGLAYWNNTNKRFDSYSGLTFNGTNLLTTADILINSKRVATVTSGTSYPSGAGLGDECYRTDLDEWYKYNGQIWMQI